MDELEAALAAKRYALANELWEALALASLDDHARWGEPVEDVDLESAE